MGKGMQVLIMKSVSWEEIKLAYTVDNKTENKLKKCSNVSLHLRKTAYQLLNFCNELCEALCLTLGQDVWTVVAKRKLMRIVF